MSTKKIWVICNDEDWSNTEMEYLILPDGIDIKKEEKKYTHKIQEYHLAKRNNRTRTWPGTFVEHLISKGAIIPSGDVLEEYWIS